MAELQERISKIQAQFVYHYVDGLNCPLWQKQKLIDAVVGTVREQAKQERERTV